MSKTRLEARPALSHPAYKFTVYFLWRTAAFSPVENKFCSDRINELWVNATPNHDFEGILTGQPLVIEGWRRFNLKRLVRILVSTPCCQNVLSKTAVSGVVSRTSIKGGELL